MTHRICSPHRIAHNYMLLFALSWTVILSTLNTTQTDALPLVQTATQIESPLPATAEESGGELPSGANDVPLPEHMKGLCRPTAEQRRDVHVYDNPFYALSLFAEAEEVRLIARRNNATSLTVAELDYYTAEVCAMMHRRLNHVDQASSTCPWTYDCTHDISRYPRYIVQAKCSESRRQQSCSGCSGPNHHSRSSSTCQELWAKDLPVLKAPTGSCEEELGSGSSSEATWKEGETIDLAIGCQCQRSTENIINNGRLSNTGASGK